MEEHLQYNMLFLYFCKLSVGSPVPDHSTICRWRERFNKFDLYEKLFTLINDQLDDKGLEIRRGGHIDATLQQSAARPRRKEVIEVEPVGDDELPENLTTAECSPLVPSIVKDKPKVLYTKTESKDPDAAWVKKGKQYTYGYKKMVITNLTGFINSVITTPANVNDCKIAIPCIEKANLEPYYPLTGDKGFDSQAIRSYLHENNLFDFIMQKKKRKEKYNEERSSRNKKISKVRFVVERTFGYIKLKLGGSRSRYIGLIKTHNSNLMKAIVYNLVRSVRQPILDKCLPEYKNCLLGNQT
jgi:IS5 family transposase